ncbi:bifunctional 2-polyprenyl-6-hydroxyphenol methylase/3-demethylubiquinol 3-O-methyltransferase UbiG [Streptomyces sp. ISL-100]|uniref:class I SAM-dependent methyltransferase n=1 Tax=Streptomyces sp. ISL-100 TaxID=2819173 RepID=UPI001BED311F|nr:class I SAM-dependent methyltransferase [Streptomyces sp. ISL-100]MBT2399520.1 class I SAM-dependent methyltransferase [Streptomyces sp. ISL-100]
MEATNLFYRDPALYDAIQSDSGSAEACQALIERHRPDATTLVDFGCGTGRDLEILAKRFDCVGVDLQTGLVDYAHRVRSGLDIRAGDMRTVRLQQRMDAVTCLGNSLAYLHDNDEISQAFATFAAHARPGALLVLCSPVAPIIRPEPISAVVETPDGPARVAIGYEWDLRTQINTMHRRWVLASGSDAQDEIRRRVLFPRELERYASAAGFEIVDMVDGSGGTGLSGPTAYTVARYTR